MTLDRYLRFRHLSRDMTDGTFRVRAEGVIATSFEEQVETTFLKAYFPLDGDLLEIEYPASYGYFLFGPAGEGVWKYTFKK